MELGRGLATSKHTPFSPTLPPPLSSSPGGEFLAITGSGFGRLQGDQSVTVGGAQCDVTSWGNTRITCRLPPLEHGQHRVEVLRGQRGLADNRCDA